VLYDGKEAVVTEGYSPYITGGWSRADVVISDKPIDYPLVSKVDALVTMYHEGLETNINIVKKGGVIVTEKTLVDASKAIGYRILEVPGIKIADRLGKRILLNVVMLGALIRAIGAVSPESVIRALGNRFPKAAELNRKAFQEGYAYADSIISEQLTEV